MTSIASARPIGLTEKDIAAEIKVSVSWLQHDRKSARLIPYYRIGGHIRYNHDRVLEALARLEEGGTSLKNPRSLKTT